MPERKKKLLPNGGYPMHTFEDLGYYCIDNLPPKLLVNLVSLAGMSSGSPRKLAVVCDLRAKELFGELTGELKHLQDIGLSYSVLFLDATDEVLLRRFKASRRRHPMCEGGMTIISGIRREREMLVEAKEIARLRRQLRDAEDALEVLKKAIGILGK